LIAKTRQDRSSVAQACGELENSSVGWRSHARFAPPLELQSWIEYFWLEQWRLEGNCIERRQLLPNPNVQLTFAADRSRIYGIQLGRFVREYTGSGRVFGIKFRVGAFFPFFRNPISSIANTSIDAARVFSASPDVAREMFACRTATDMVDGATHFLRANLPPMDPTVDIVRSLVDVIINDREVRRVRDLALRLGTSDRNLQRLFHRYVGASPRWVIKRYRAYEAIDSLNDPRLLSLSALAQHLGYVDQAHFSNDFKMKVGKTPLEYRCLDEPGAIDACSSAER
jgi:AraC-like DNA-binding protein